MTPKQEQAIRNHGENIKTIFSLPESTDPVNLCKQLRRLEVKAHKAAEDYCNGYISSEKWETLGDEILQSLVKILGYTAHSLCFVNGDPRGYALKIKWEKAEGLKIYKDWGGYGILAPEIGKEGY